MSTSTLSPTIDYLRSPFNNVLQILPEGHEKALKQAFYNTIALVFVILVSSAAVAVYYILEVFIRSLLWAVLVGTFLHPFKNTLTRALQRWLHKLRLSSTPLIIGTITIPIQIFDTVAETVCYFVVTHIKLLSIMAMALAVTIVLYYFGSMLKIVAALTYLFQFLSDTIGILSTKWVWSLIVAYVAIVVFYWRPSSSRYLKMLSLPMWIAIFLQIATLTGPFKIPLVIALAVMLIVGCVTEMKSQSEETDVSDESPARRRRSAFAMFGLINPESSTHGPAARSPSTGGPSTGGPVTGGPVTRPEPHPASTTSGTNPRIVIQGANATTGHRSLSDKYFIALFWALLFARIWVNVWILQLLPALLAYLLLKRAVAHIGGVDFLKQKMLEVLANVDSWFKDRQDAIFPAPLRGLGRLSIQGDKRIVQYLENSLDGVISIFIILALIVLAILSALFICIQVQQETMHLLTVSSNVLNSTLHPELSHWLPNSEDMQTAVDSMISNVFVYGREYISTKVKHVLNGEQKDAEKLERQILEIYDRLYENWVSRNVTVAGDTFVTYKTPDVGLQLSNLTSVWHAVKNMDALNTGDLLSYAQENVGTVMSVMDSIWLVLKGNLSLVFNIVTAILSVVFGGGTAIFNFIIASIVFLTTLFYLLASSGDRYKPVDIIMDMVPSESSPTANSFGNAVEAAISGVFMASFKMAAFYGLYTWLTHTIFQIKIVFIPSALAALFGAVPFLGPYWAALPAVVELWLVQGDGLRAILLLVCQMLPSYVVDTAIYREIKGGGHPYLTGLAIVGGLYWLGIEGAIIGPIILCSLVVLVNVCSTVMNSTDTSNPTVTEATQHTIPDVEATQHTIPDVEATQHTIPDVEATQHTIPDVETHNE